MSTSLDSLTEEVTNHPTIDEVFSLLPDDERKNLFTSEIVHQQSTPASPPADLVLYVVYQEKRYKIVGQRLSIGRVAIADLRVNDNQVSTRHCYIEHGMLIDTNSTNGTFVNTKKLEPEQPYKLELGDVIQIGSSHLHIVTDQPAGAVAGTSASSGVSESSTVSQTIDQASSSNSTLNSDDSRSPLRPQSSNTSSGIVGASPNQNASSGRLSGMLSPDQVLGRVSGQQPQTGGFNFGSFGAASIGANGLGEAEPRLRTVLSVDEILASKDPRAYISMMRDDLMLSRRREHAMRRRMTDFPKDMMESYNKLQSENDYLKANIYYGADLSYFENHNKADGKSVEAEQALQNASFVAEVKSLREECVNLEKRAKNAEAEFEKMKKSNEDLKIEIEQVLKEREEKHGLAEVEEKLLCEQEGRDKDNTEKDALILSLQEELKLTKESLEEQKQKLISALHVEEDKSPMDEVLAKKDEELSSVRNELKEVLERHAKELEDVKENSEKVSLELESTRNVFLLEKEALESSLKTMQDENALHVAEKEIALTRAEKAEKDEKISTEKLLVLEKKMEDAKSVSSVPTSAPSTDQASMVPPSSHKKKCGPNAVESLRSGLDKLFVALVVESGANFRHREELEQALKAEDSDILFSFLESEKYIEVVSDVSRFISSSAEMKQQLEQAKSQTQNVQAQLKLHQQQCASDLVSSSVSASASSQMQLHNNSSENVRLLALAAIPSIVVGGIAFFLGASTK